MPPLGFVRVGDRRLLTPVEGPDLDKARRAFELYASGIWSDTTLADELGLRSAKNKATIRAFAHPQGSRATYQ